jgi:DNA-binding protein HU-beta
MTKAEFVVRFAEKTGMSKKDAANVVNAFFEVTAEALKAGDKVVFPGVFKAEITERKARTD